MIFRTLLAVTILLCFYVPAHAKRVALVIGNASYTELTYLQKTHGDASGYRDALAELGFDVTHHTDLDFFRTAQVVGDFISKIEQGDEVAFVFAGHGWSDGRTNYLLPTNAPKSGTDAQLVQLSLPLKNGANGILDQITKRGATLNFSVIDACRDNPFIKANGTRSAGLARGGLSAISAAAGSFVVYSAGEGQTALDRLSNTDTNPYSVFSRVFIPKLRSGVSLEQAANETQQEVSGLAAGIGHSQQPAYYDQALGNTVLKLATSNMSRIGVVPNPAPVTTLPPATAFNAAAEMWKRCDEGQELYCRELAQGSSPYASLARIELQKFKKPAPVVRPIPIVPAIAALPADPCRDHQGLRPSNATCVVENGRAVWLSKGPSPAEIARQQAAAAEQQRAAALAAERQRAEQARLAASSAAASLKRSAGTALLFSGKSALEISQIKATARRLKPQELQQGSGETSPTIPGGRIITTPELIELIESGRDHAIIDVYGSSPNIPNSVSASSGDRNQLFKRVTAGNKNMAIVIYCLNSTCGYSRSASLEAIKAGYRNVLWYRGGIDNWKSAGLPVR